MNPSDDHDPQQRLAEETGILPISRRSLIISAGAAFLLPTLADAQAVSPISGRPGKTKSRPELVVQLGHASDYIESAIFSPDGRCVLTVGDDDFACLWEAATGRSIRDFRGHHGRVRSAVFSSDGRTILTAGSDETVRLWNAATGKETGRLEVAGKGLRAAVFSPRDTYVLTTSGTWGNGIARIWSVGKRSEISQFEGGNTAISPDVFSPDEHFVLIANRSGVVRRCETETGKEVQRFDRKRAPEGIRMFEDPTVPFPRINLALPPSLPNDEVSAVFSPPKGDRVLTLESDGIARVWGAEDGNFRRQFARDDSPGMVKSAAFSADGVHVMVQSRYGNRAPRVWETETGSEVAHLRGRWRSPDFSPDGQLMVSTGTFQWGGGFLRDTAAFAAIRGFQGHGLRVMSTCFSPDGRCLLAAGVGSAFLWDTAVGNETLRIPNGLSKLAIYSPDGKSILMAPHLPVPNPRVPTGGPIGDFHQQERAQDAEKKRSPAQAPNGTDVPPTGFRLAGFRLLDAATGKEIRSFGPNGGEFAAFSPDGSLVAVGGGTISLWDGATGSQLGDPLRAFVGTDGRLAEPAVFSPRARYLLTFPPNAAGAMLWEILQSIAPATGFPPSGGIELVPRSRTNGDSE